MFIDRLDAGRRLAEKLLKFRGRADAIVIALPRGGVVLGRAVADVLDLPLDIVVPRKIGAPGDAEYAIGAVTEAGEPVWNEAERRRVSDAYADRAVREQRAEAERRLRLYRAGRTARDLSGRTVIIVDDGIATGYTMRAAVSTVRAAKPAAIVVAVPVVPPDSAEDVRRVCDELVALETPQRFSAIGAFYEKFDQVEDSTVIDLMGQHSPGRKL